MLLHFVSNNYVMDLVAVGKHRKVKVDTAKDYSPNKEALKVDYLVGLSSLAPRGGKVPEHG